MVEYLQYCCPFRIAAITFQLSLKLIIITLLTLCCNIWILYRSPSIHIHVVLYNQFFSPANKNRRWYLEGCSEKIEISIYREAYNLMTTWSLYSADYLKHMIWWYREALNLMLSNPNEDEFLTCTVHLSLNIDLKEKRWS